MSLVSGVYICLRVCTYISAHNPGRAVVPRQLGTAPRLLQGHVSNASIRGWASGAAWPEVLFGELLKRFELGCLIPPEPKPTQAIGVVNASSRCRRRSEWHSGADEVRLMPPSDPARPTRRRPGPPSTSRVSSAHGRLAAGTSARCAGACRRPTSRRCALLLLLLLLPHQNHQRTPARRAGSGRHS